MQTNLFSRQPPSFRSFIIAVITCWVVLFFNWHMPHVIQPARDVLYAAYNPIYALASYPVLSREWLNQQTKSEAQLRRENTAMHAELLQAQVRLQKLSELSAENTRLRGLLDTPLIIDGRMEIAEVIGTDADPLRHIIVINRGASSQLKVGQTVLDDKGIMGQIINVYPNTSRLLLITDEQQSVAVTVKRTGQRAIVTGEGIPTSLRLNYVFKTSDVRVGDELVSSGLGGRIPAGYRVGRIAHVEDTQADNFRSIEVTPAANFIDNAYVLVLQDKLSNERNAGISEN